MKKEEFDNEIRMLITEKNLLLKSLRYVDLEIDKEEIRKRLIYIKGEIQILKKKFNERGLNNE